MATKKKKGTKKKSLKTKSVKKVGESRTLKGRKRKVSRGEVLRVSEETHAFLNGKRIGTKAKAPSWDNFFRSVFGREKRNGERQPLIVGWVEIHSGRFFLRRSEARGQAVVEAAKRGVKNITPPIKMREIRW